jgi:hypothetical protein
MKAELPGNRELFERIYKYAFTIAKTANSRQAALEQAIEFWKLLFGSPLSPIKWNSANTPWLDWWEEFLTTSFKKSINKDMWNETLKFAKLTLTDDAMTSGLRTLRGHLSSTTSLIGSKPRSAAAVRRRPWMRSTERLAKVGTE